MRILLIKTSSLGDVIHNLPIVSDLRRAFPGAAIDWCVEESFTDIPRLHPDVADIIPVAVRRWRKTLFQSSTWREIGAFRKRIKLRYYDAVLDTQGLIKSALIARIARGHRYGYAREAAREPFAARFYDEIFVIPSTMHAVERNRWLASAAFGYAIGSLPDYGINAPGRDFDWMTDTPFCLLFTASSRNAKLWDEANWVSLAQALFDREKLTPVLPSGTPEERARAERIARQLPEAIVAPPLQLHELASLIKKARIAIGVDTGLIHLATALRTPSLALYLASDPALTGIYGAGFHRNLGAPGQAPAVAEVLTVAGQALFESRP
ncbi:MAG: lipopolysaccharide heptosyltransferase I [Candidatus Accumulibacter sp.]|nr:lipopolysaccharide heptosyltransferase I [Accumulibacter sp.]